ncbi:hypothetical protein [Gramella sp. KN1008]|uniref:hypothetical protein n=1 Tax=Gramella sp. KN1008 TaxID=2529298 RepID=UPI00103B1FE5|nr:hypothetical protein [Gramella sp. KN1008]TBW27580.1 hypothetical protein EZJ28_11455 [Gramella sp. KN1008]
MKNFYLLIMCFLVSVASNAQNEDLEQEIMNYSDSKSQLISKGRKLLLDSFMEENIQKVRKIKDYLVTEIEDEDYVALYPSEEWMILYWTGEYYALMDMVLEFSEEDFAEFQRKITPEKDQLYFKLVERSMAEIEELESKIIASSLEQEQKDFLILHLNYMVSGEPLNTVPQEDINEMADLYLDKYSSGKFHDYVRNNIRFRFKSSNWGFGFEFFSGYGIFNGEISDQYNNHAPMGVALDVEYKNFTLFLRNYIGFSKTLRDREFDQGTWEKGAAVLVFLPEASIGYSVLENDKLKLSPFAGIGAAAVSPITADVEKRPELEDLQIGFSTAYTLGVNLNMKLGWETGTLIPNEKTYWFVRLRYGYTIPQFDDYPGYNGNVHTLTLGIGGIVRGVKRDL